jgi:hypothetical protein
VNGFYNPHIWDLAYISERVYLDFAAVFPKNYRVKFRLLGYRASGCTSSGLENPIMPANRNSADGTGLRWVLTHPVIWFFLATAMLIFASLTSWSRYRDRLYEPKSFQLTAESIKANPVPAWFQDELAVAVNELLGLGHSLLDRRLVSHVNSHLATKPWIRRVERVEKSSSGLTLQLQSREPVAFVVELDGEREFPIDGDGVWLAETALSSQEFELRRGALMRIYVPKIDSRLGTSWQVWPDYRIVHAAKLCEFLGDVAEKLKLYRVVSFCGPELAERADLPFELWTRNGTRVHWGSCPGFETENEADARIKLAALKRFVVEHGELPSFAGQNEFKIDVSRGSVSVLPAPRTAEIEPWIDLRK